MSFNVYCDESSHLEHDPNKVMVVGALWCPVEETRAHLQNLKAIVVKHGFPPAFEFKWTKVSPAKFSFYKELIDYFWDHPNLKLRCVVVPDKSKLDHVRHGQTHDIWYYKILFLLLSGVLKRDESFFIFLDIKDTRGQKSVEKLGAFLRSRVLDFDSQIVKKLQTVRSNEVRLLQMTDLIIGAVNYANRNDFQSPAKAAIVEHIRLRSRLTLTKSTLVTDDKLNILIWKAQD